MKLSLSQVEFSFNIQYHLAAISNGFSMIETKEVKRHCATALYANWNEWRQ